MPAPSLMPCPTCELEFAWPPVERARRAYCCDGCAAGGPCCCSYDDSPQLEVTMNAQSPTGGASAAPVRWIPMTAEAFSHLEAEADRLVAAVGDSQSTAWADGISGDLDAPTFVANGEFDLLVRRLEKLRGAIANAHVVRPDGRAVVGSRITVSDADGSLDTYVLVAPGEADPRAGHISPESPLGAALLERRAGDLVEIAAPAGRRRMAVVSVEQSKLGWSRRS
jgi:transcription elongation factor GreA